MDKIFAIIQARMGSTRLPGKVMLNLEGKTVLEHVVERLRKAKTITEAVVAITTADNDIAIVDHCVKKNIRYYRGSENDVLDRYYSAAKLIGAAHVVRITADCPLIDPKVVDKVIELHLDMSADYTSNTIKDTFPDGEDTEVFTFETLARAWEEADLPSEREHVTPYIRKNRSLFKLSNLECGRDLSAKRWTLDEDRDYEFIKLIYRELYEDNPFFGMDEVLKLLEDHPEYERINRGIGRNEGYSKSLNDDRLFIGRNKKGGGSRG